ncbi:MAG: outer membrane lipoprotein-sorting protein [Acidobacteriota bacterium]|nr:outer membrane lipoprotein-sorting protein [Acidobacteriota bacterium]
MRPARYPKLPIFLLLSAVLASAQAPDAKQDKQPAPPLTVDQILDNYTSARGGIENIRRIKSILEKVSQQSGKKVETFTTSRKAPDKYATLVDTVNGPKKDSGCDGRTYWMMPPDEANQGRVVFDEGRLGKHMQTVGEFRILPIYKKAKLRGTKKVNDKPAYMVEFEQEDGDRRTYYIDVQSFLLLRSDSESKPFLKIVGPSTLETSRGPIQLPPNALGGDSMERGPKRTLYYSDWREVDGVIVAFEVKDEDGVTKTLNFRINADIDDRVFAPPPDSIQVSPKQAGKK